MFAKISFESVEYFLINGMIVLLFLIDGINRATTCFLCFLKALNWKTACRPFLISIIVNLSTVLTNYLCEVNFSLIVPIFSLGASSPF